MSYAIYTTEAIVLRIISQGEASIDAVLFTRDLGKITVRAQSARKQESKMRMHLTRFRVVTVDLVKGKNTWRLTGITGEAVAPAIAQDATLKPLYRVFRLSEFLIQGEVAHPELYGFFKSYVATPPQNIAPPSITDETLSKGFEIFGVIKLLEHLGYWNGQLFDFAPEHHVLEHCYTNRKDLVKKINESISATQIMVY